MNESFPRFDSGRARTLSACRAGLAALLVALPLAGFAPLAHAERADKDKPLNIEADNMTYDDLKQVNQYATGTSSGGNLSYFRQKREGLNEYVEGTAIRIDYDGKQDLTTLTTNATVNRLQGLSTVIDTVHGSVITYDGQSDFYTAKAGPDVAGPGNPSGRVRAMLSPRNGGAAPLTGASATLAPSTTLKGAPAQ
jgi:lipopolysaccharide export system protein LptA